MSSPSSCLLLMQEGKHLDGKTIHPPKERRLGMKLWPQHLRKRTSPPHLVSGVGCPVRRLKASPGAPPEIPTWMGLYQHRRLLEGVSGLCYHLWPFKVRRKNSKNDLKTKAPIPKPQGLNAEEVLEVFRNQSKTKILYSLHVWGSLWLRRPCCLSIPVSEAVGFSGMTVGGS